MLRCRYLSPLTIGFLIAFGGAAHGQTAQRSSLEVIVVDPNGAVVPGASITLSGTRLLGGTRVVQSDGTGRYEFSGLLPGSYDLAAAAKGFQTVQRSKVELPVETTYTVSLKLALQGVTERVDVRATQALIDARTSATPALFDEALLHDLPVERTLGSILSLAPGVTTTSKLFGYVGEVAYGGTQGSNGFTVDGVNLTEASLGNQWTQVHYNWIEQAQVIGLGAPAEYGSFTGAIVNGVLRSGSNSVRGMGELLTIRPKWTANNSKDIPPGGTQPVPPETILSWWDVNGQIGAPIVKDRLWAFGGVSHVHHEFRNYGYSGPGSSDEGSGLALAKVDAAPSNGVRLQGFVSRDRSDTIGAYVSASNPTLESSPDEFIRRYAWNARATWVASPTTIIEARTNGNTGTDRFEPHAPATLEGPSPSTDGSTGVACCNSFWRREGRSSLLAAATIEHLHDGRLGSHDLKGGVEWNRSPVDEQDGIPTNQSLTTVNGQIVQIEQWMGDHTHLTSTQTALYLEDRWRLTDRITIEPGMRLELNRGQVPGVSSSYQTSPLVPRLGVAWDVTGTQSTVVRAHYGRYSDPLYGSVYQYTQPNSHSPHVFYQIVDGQPVEAFRYIEEYALPAPSALKQSHVDQFVAGLERSLNANTTFQVQYIGRRFGHFIGWIDQRISDWTPVQVKDPGPDGVTGTADDGGLFTVYQVYGQGIDISDRALELGNPENAYRSYNALQFIADRRFARNWQYQISYTWSRSHGTIGNEYNTNATSFSTNPFGYGADPNKQTAPPAPPVYDYSEFKALSSYRPPWLGGFTTAAAFRWHSGTHWTRIAVVRSPAFISFPAEPLNSRVTPSVGALDLRVEKTFSLVHAQTFGLYVDLFNLTNVGRALAYNQNSGPNFGLVRDWTSPRTGRLGVRYTF